MIGKRVKCLCLLILLTGLAWEALSGRLVKKTFMPLKKAGLLILHWQVGVLLTLAGMTKGPCGYLCCNTTDFHPLMHF